MLPASAGSSSRTGSLRALGLALATLLGGCVELETSDVPPEQPATCGSGPTCVAPESCVHGVCVAPGPASCTRAGDPACEATQRCTVAADAACGAESCAAPTTCREAVGAREGLFTCASDGDCASGRCAGGVCLQICAGDGDCPARFGCGSLTLTGGLVVKGCLGEDRAGEADPGLSLCRSSGSCAAGRVCRIRAMPDALATFGETEAVCEPVPGGASGSPGRGCGGPDSCESGLCARPCPTAGTFADVCAGFRCSQLCEADDGCPSPYTCGGILDGSDVSGVPLRFCTLPIGGCFDDSDCCPRLDGAGACQGAWAPGETACAIEEVAGRIQRFCRDPGALGGRYARCAVAADCASALCTGSAGCASPCLEVEDRCGESPGGGVCRPYAGSEAEAVCVDLSACGDGVRSESEPCDGDDVGGATCTAPGGGTTAPLCGPGCELDRSPCACTGDDDCPYGPCDAGACLCWHAVRSDQDANLEGCAGTEGGDRVVFRAHDSAIPSGDEACAAAGAGPCSEVRDWGCHPFTCGQDAGPSRMALCRCAP